MSETIYQPGSRGDAEHALAVELDRLAADVTLRARRERDAAIRREGARFHTVTVTTRLDDAGTPDERRRVDEVRFVCTAPEDAECRTYPECDCESWHWNEDRTADEDGHPRVTGQECWLQGWFDAEQGVYTGEDGDDMRDDMVPAIDRSGPITATFLDEWIEWDFMPELHDSGSER